MRTLNIGAIEHDSVVNGEGIRSVIYTQGCSHECPDCHNPETHSYETGTNMTVADIVREIEDNNISKKVTISGGEPFDQENLVELLFELKKHGYDIVVYTGYTWKYIVENKPSCIEFINVLVDGRFIKERKDNSKLHRGSTNQEIIKIK